MRIVLNGNPNIAGLRPQPHNGRCQQGAFAPQRGFDAEKLFDSLLREFAPVGRRVAPPTREQRVGLRVASWERPDGWLLRAEVPGVSREQLEVSVDGNVLSLKATRALDVPEGFRLVRGERRGTEASARFELPQDTDVETIAATLRDGILEVTIARRPTNTRRIVPVLTAESVNHPDPTPNGESAATVSDINTNNSNH